MKWFWLSPTPLRRNNWVLYHAATASQPVRLRERYREFACTECHKVDEDAALRSGIDNVALKALSDVLLTSDNLLCFSKRLRDILASNGVSGLDFLEIPGQRNYQVTLPTRFAEVDVNKTTYIYADRDEEGREIVAEFCSTCGRPLKGRYELPPLASLSLPEDPLVVVAPTVAMEDLRGKVYWVLVSEVVRQILRDNEVSGVKYPKPS